MEYETLLDLDALDGRDFLRQLRLDFARALALVVVLLGLLLTVLIGEPGVRGVPIRAA